MSDDEFGFDPADTELGARLRAAAPPAGDADAVLAGLRPRLARARRRRQAVLATTGVATLALLVGIGAVVAGGRGPGARVDVPPANRTPVVTSEPRPPAAPEPVPTTDAPPVPTTDDRSGSNSGRGSSSDDSSDSDDSGDDSGSNSGRGSGNSGSGRSGSGRSGGSDDD